VAGQVVVRERQRGECDDIRRDDELQNHAQPAPRRCHTRSIRPDRREPLTPSEMPAV
jgi:hypothetical protein